MQLTPDEIALTFRAAQELRGRSAIELRLGPSVALALLGVVQMALRHPEFGENGPEFPRRAALDFGAALQERLSEAGPNVAEMCRRGWGD